MMGGGFGGGRWMGRMGRGPYSRGTAGRQGYEEDDEGGQIYDHTVVTRLFRYLLPHWPRLLLTLASVIVYTGAVVAIPWMVALIIDDYVQTGDLSGLNVVVPIFVGLALVQLGSQYLHSTDDGVGRSKSSLHLARGALQTPPGPLHELLQQERGRKGDVGCPERRAATPGGSCP